ncbi:MAG: hypothetical protein E7234_01150 [Lachnospiraceae bacterium]|nr:hypothetical protein [Lachnospiraceae bacterium]
MKRLAAAIILVLLGAVVLGVGAYFSYGIFNNPSQKPEQLANTALLPETPKDTDIEANNIKEEEIVKIKPYTKMIYEYYYKDDRNTERSEEEPPHFMIGKTKEEMEITFDQWEIVKFTEEEVIMRRQMEGSSAQNYIVGVQDGYVAVFYNEAIDGAKIKEITDTPVSALPEDERQKLLDGISISGEEALMRLLEDYTS